MIILRVFISGMCLGATIVGLLWWLHSIYTLNKQNSVGVRNYGQ